ncbi:MAG: hypothetical protein H7201_02275 [Candidatus Saccharibacteria bacterium]|nr:hypothetical protein [Microbacteriaceae bacterium]
MDPFVRGLLDLSPIDADAERALARSARSGDVAARDALITSGMRAVVLRARMWGLAGEALRDAVQSGAVGLIGAVDRFDPDRGARLSTFAWHFIGASMVVRHPHEVGLEGFDREAPEPREMPTDVLEGMPPELAEVLSMRFGLDDGSPLPLPRRVVAERLGLSVAQVRTVEAKAMRQVSERLAKVVDRAPPVGGADPL